MSLYNFGGKRTKKYKQLFLSSLDSSNGSASARRADFRRVRSSNPGERKMQWLISSCIPLVMQQMVGQLLCLELSENNCADKLSIAVDCNVN